MKRRIIALSITLALLLSLVSGFAASGSFETVKSGRLSVSAGSPLLAMEKSAPKKIKITGSKYVAKGKKITLKATVTPADASQKVIWSSSDEKIATVTKKGVVKGVKAGTVTITATSSADSKVQKTWKLKVMEKAASKVTITNAVETLDLAGTKSVKLKASIDPAKAAQSVEWTSSDPSVATVSTKGTVKAISVGTVKITATATDGSKKKAAVTIHVIDSSVAPTLEPTPTLTPTPEPTPTLVPDPTPTPALDPTPIPVPETPTPAPFVWGKTTFHIPETIHAGQDFDVSFEPVEGANHYYGFFASDNSESELIYNEDHLAHVHGYIVTPGKHTITLTVCDTINNKEYVNTIEFEAAGQQPDAPDVRISSDSVKPNEDYSITINTEDVDLIHYTEWHGGYGHTYDVSADEEYTEIRFNHSEEDKYRYEITVRKNGFWSNWIEVAILVIEDADRPTAPSGPPELSFIPERPEIGRDFTVHVQPQEGVSFYYCEYIHGQTSAVVDFSSENDVVIPGYEIDEGELTIRAVAVPIISDGKEHETITTFRITGARPEPPVTSINRTSGTKQDDYTITMDTTGIKKVFYELTVNGGGTLRTIDVNENSTQIHLNISETGPYQFKAVALKEEGIWTKWIDPISFVVTE